MIAFQYWCSITISSHSLSNFMYFHVQLTLQLLPQWYTQFTGQSSTCRYTAVTGVQGLFPPRYFRSSEWKFPLGTFAPWNESSRELSLPGAKVPWNFRSRERMFPGTFVPRSDNTGERTVRVTTSYTMHKLTLKPIYTEDGVFLQFRVRVSWVLQ